MSNLQTSLAEQMSSNVAAATDIMKALSNDTRLMLMCCLMDGEMSVNALADVVEMRLPAVSQHLSKMRTSGLVNSRRDAQTVYYSANEGIGNAIVQTLCQHFK